MINLFVIEDHYVTTSGLRTFFRGTRDGIQVIGSALSTDEAIGNREVKKADIILLDLWLKSTDPILNLKMMQENYPTKPVVIFTSEESSVWQRKMMEAGAMGYISKAASKTEIKSALTKVIDGLAVFSVAIETYDDERGMTSRSKGISNSLTRRQQELLRLLSRGISQHIIAKELGISSSTVEKSLKILRDKFEVKNNNELVRYIVSNRLLS